MKQTVRFGALVVLTFILAACGGGGGGSPSTPSTYTVSGTIVDSDGDGIKDVTVGFGGKAEAVQTNENGHWSRDGLTGTVTVTPAHLDYTFEPGSQRVTKAAAGVDFEGTFELRELGLRIDVPSTTVDVDNDVQLKAEVTGTYADAAEVTWSAVDEDGVAAGTFNPDTSAPDETVTWQAPAEEGEYTITAAAATGDENAVDVLVLTVEYNELGIAISAPTWTTVREDVEFIAEVTGSYAHLADITWETPSAGELSNTSGAEVTWTAPDTIGATVTLRATATVADGPGAASVYRETDIEVRLCHAGSVDSEGDPCEIRTVYQLDAMRNELNGHFALGGDIEASATRDWDNGAGFEPVGDDSDPFTGSLDGRGYELSGLYIHRPNEDDVGLFGFVGPDGVVRDLRFIDGEVEGKHNVGMAIGSLDQGQLVDVYSDGTVRGDAYVGGFVGHIKQSGFPGGLDPVYDIDGAHHAGSVTGVSNVGGILGMANRAYLRKAHNDGSVKGSSVVGGVIGDLHDGGVITMSSNRGDVTGEQDGSDVGGIAGRSGYATISLSYNDASVTGGTGVGGIAGTSQGNLGVPGRRNIEQSYNLGDVKGSTKVGGLAGGFRNQNEIAESYSAGSVTGDTEVGGLVGEPPDDKAFTKVLASYFDKEKAATAHSDGGEGKTTAQMQTESTYTAGSSPWDFDDVWSMGAGEYPDLMDNSRYR